MVFMSVGLARYAARPLLIQQWFPLENINMVNAVMSVVGFGAVPGVLVFFMGDLLLALNGWRNIFYLFGCIQVVILLVWVILARECPAPTPAPSETESTGREPFPLKALFKYKALRLLGLGVAGDMFCFGAMETLWPKYAVPKGIFSLDQASNVLGLSFLSLT